MRLLLSASKLAGYTGPRGAVDKAALGLFARAVDEEADAELGIL